MKSKKILLLENVLRLMAAVVLKRHKPSVVAITGSVGKTSAKNAIFEVLSSKFFVRENQKNYNNEIGIPLTIIGAESGGSSFLGWLAVLLKWLIVLISPNYPKILVLELGVDRPGDMAYFMSFIKPVVGVVTNISASHLEFFGTVEGISKEKKKLVRSLDEKGFAILNGDDESVRQMKRNLKAEVIEFGFDQDCPINASSLSYNYREGVPDGISFKLNYDGKNIPIRLKNILAGHYVYAALAAVSTGIVFKLNLVEIAQALENLKSPVGRMNLICGINGSHIVDDTYNASPVSTSAALDTLSELHSQRRIAVLGDMLELGEHSEAGHSQIVKKVLELPIDSLLVIGKRMEEAVKKLADEGFSIGKIMTFDDHQKAVTVLKGIVKNGDFILVKGSQGMRMEKVIEGILANPDQAKKLLCRQSRQWRKKPFLLP